MTTTAHTAPVILIEPDAARVGGHWHAATERLADQAQREGRACTVITLNGMPPAASAALRTAGARVVEQPPSGAWAARMFAYAATVLRRLSRAAGRMGPHRRFPHQVTLLARCCAETAALRVAAHLHPDGGAVVVILSASEALHAATAALSRQPHLRVVHEVTTTEDRLVRELGRRAWAGGAPLRAVCPTAAVRDQLAAQFPAVPMTVRPFALADAQPRLDERERATARASFGIRPGERVVVLVGGWWPHKDIATVVAAAHHLTEPLHVVVAGHPIDHALMGRLDAAPRVRLHQLIGDLPRTVLRQVYASADATIITRRPGIGKESGLLADAAILGVPAIVSDHDPATSRLLNQLPWIRLVAAHDPGALAAALDALTLQPISVPGLDAAAQLGFRTAADTLDLYTALMPTRPHQSSEVPCPFRR